MQEPKTLYRPEIELSGTTALVATDYTKRPNVFRVKLANGGDYLFQTKDEVRIFVVIICFIFYTSKSKGSSNTMVIKLNSYH